LYAPRLKKHAKVGKAYKLRGEIAAAIFAAYREITAPFYCTGLYKNRLKVEVGA
jgi:hypothetical protein